MVEALRWHECFSAIFSSNLIIGLGALNYCGEISDLGSILMSVVCPVIYGGKKYVVRFYVPIRHVFSVV